MNPDILTDREFRMLYGLPVEGETGLNMRQETILLQIHQKEGVKKAQKWLRKVRQGINGHLLGRKAEEFFISSWNDADYRHLGVRSVRAATEEEDHCHETDAVMSLVNGINLRIQIKTNFLQRQNFMYYLEKKIFLVIVRPGDLPKDVRKNTLAAILRYKELSELQQTTS
jgi:hypothetical protein